MEEEIIDRQDSIEVSKNNKNEYSWKIKIYFDSEINGQKEAIITRIKEIDTTLRINFR